MRLAGLLLLLALPASGSAGILATEKRAWRGVFEVRSLSREPTDGQGREEQRERVEFLLVSTPPDARVRVPRVPFELRKGTGSFHLRVDVTEGKGKEAVLTHGQRDGPLYPRISGVLNPKTGFCGLQVVITPKELVTKATLSGIDKGRFQTFRTVLTRALFLQGLKVEGELTGDGRLFEGERKLVDREGKHPRDVTITWRMERVDPVVAGRVVDHLGRPVPDIEVLARTTNPQRVRNRMPPIVKRVQTDAHGRFAMDAFWGQWSLEVVGAERGGTVFESRTLEGGVNLRFDDAPEVEVTLRAYRLRALPDSKLLKGHFRGDVGAYLEYIRRRAADERMRRALVPASAR
ncbi:MAG: carboxypeptidase-like regulatory domain-containing protein [Planctomycetota bacterium]|jgi:hypothetical protein